MTTALRILALPWGRPALVRDAGPGGEPILFREVFQRDSFADLPDRVPILRLHNREMPIGWGKPTIKDDGLEVVAELVGTQRAADSTVEIREKLMAGASVGFSANERQDRWSMPKISAAIPQVIRRGATLYEVSIVPQGAYADAHVAEVFDRDARSHELSERLLAPVRRAAAVTAAELRERDQELLRWVDGLTPVVRFVEPVVVVAAPEPVGPLARIGAATFRVAGDADPSIVTDRYLTEVVSELTRRNRALHGDELLLIQQRCGLSPVQ